jgi:hypothetical protein
MFRVYSGKFCGAIDDRADGFKWSVTLVDTADFKDNSPIAKGVTSTMEEAIIATYKAMGGAKAAKGGHETEIPDPT